MRKTRRLVAALFAAIALVGGMALVAPSVATAAPTPAPVSQQTVTLPGGTAEAFVNATGTSFDHVVITPTSATPKYGVSGTDANMNQVYNAFVDPTSTDWPGPVIPAGVATTLPHDGLPDNSATFGVAGWGPLPDGIVTLWVSFDDGNGVSSEYRFWLNGAPGPQGPAGPQGPQGLVGPAGANGADGQPGAIGPAGPAGTNGTNGVDGATGPAGPQGPVGPAFTQQPTSVTESAGTVVAFPNAAGTSFDHVVVTPTAEMPLYGLQAYDARGTVVYSVYTVVPGTPGPALPANVATTLPNAQLTALDPAWTPLPDGVVALEVYFYNADYTVSLDHTFGLTGAPGPVGPMGPDGATGPAGPAGADGATGAVGPAGAVGPQGLPGATGAVGPAGAKGDTGSQGADGAVGPKGDTGAAGTNGVDGAPGAKGDTGLTGMQGLIGPAGPIGPVGPAGADGAQGPKGDTGAAGNNGTDGLPGDTGAVGPAGATGAVGPAGDTGATGAVGPTGATGATGPAGPSVGANVMIDPVRIADSRISQGFPTWTTAGVQNLHIVGAGIPTTGVAGVILNVTTTNAQFGGYLTTFPAGSAQPLASTNNFQPGVNVPNGVTVKVGANNTISIYATGRVDVVVDVMGYVTG